MHRVALCWLRRDLRLADNPAISYACEHADSVVLAFVHAPEEEAPWEPGAASRWWLHHSLLAIAETLRQRRVPFVVRSGPSLTALRELIAETAATLVVWNRLYEPRIVARDKNVKAALIEDGLEVRSFNAALLFEPWEVRTKSGEPYRVFTPYWRTCMASLEALPPPAVAPRFNRLERARSLSRKLRSLEVEELGLLPRVRWDTGLRAEWIPGEDGAQKRLQTFAQSECERYGTCRDFPGIDGTSHLSPHLHFGELGPRQIVAALGHSHSADLAGSEAFLRELGWREFAHHVLFHFPYTSHRPFDERFARVRWKKSAALLRAWQKGATGFPMIDAGMRELWTTGYMHNRVRMLTASFLTKNLGIHWLEGARWFWDTLVDADLANNSLGWQWTAGCGTDAAPYFRIFNPETQSERFDREASYLQRWLPELSKLSSKSIHAPQKASASELKAAGIALGKTYPKPVVDLKLSREEALERFKATSSRSVSDKRQETRDQ